jgi:hypothetical protein
MAGSPDEGWRALAAEEAHPGLERVGHVLRAAIVADGKAAGDLLAGGAEVPSHAISGSPRREPKAAP